MEPQGNQPINVAYFSSLIGQVEAVASCAELQSLVTRAFASLAAYVAGLAKSSTALSCAYQLLTPPTDLPSLISWVENLINCVLGPQYKAYENYAAKVAALAIELPLLVTGIENAAAALKNCSITIPTIGLPSIPVPP
ncbi:MAG TPA: hypothetical protein VHX52_14410 [Steroidobacteraceae bacterium]|nr:hypothetical protein [Steroidobacteraceae bacterium]